MDINQLADQARQSISDYCINDCKGYCCRKGFLSLNEDQVKLVVGNHKSKLVNNNHLIESHDQNFLLDLGNPINCPSQKNNKCSIHTNPNRPSACKEFPVFIWTEGIKLSNRCPAVREGKLYPFVRQFVKAGFKII